MRFQITGILSGWETFSFWEVTEFGTSLRLSFGSDVGFEASCCFSVKEARGYKKCLCAR